MYLRLAYIPMDSNLSVDRISSISKSFSPIAFITDDDDDVDDSPYQTPLFKVAQLLDQVQASNATKVEPLYKYMKNPVILLLFTSGSTSPIPKGVALRNSQLANRLFWQWSRASPMADLTGPGLAKTSWLFVDAFTEMFGPLLGGRAIVVSGSSRITSERIVSDAKFLGTLVSQIEIAQITTVPSQLESWLNQLGDETEAFQSLRLIVSSGQMLPFPLAIRIFEVLKQRPLRLVNLYGSTEVAGDITAVAFDNIEDIQHVAVKLPSGGHLLPVGKPIFNSEIYVVSGDSEVGSLKPVERGREGEVLASGAGILIEEPISSSKTMQ